MSDAGAVEALKAAFRGVVRSSEALGPLRERIEGLNEGAGPDAELLAELARVAAGVAIAAAALRALGETLGKRDG